MAKFKGSVYAKSTSVSIKLVPKPKVCLACNGSGKYDVSGSPKCASCNGTGIA